MRKAQYFIHGSATEYGVLEINFIVCVLPLGKPTENISTWNMSVFCHSSLCFLNLGDFIWKGKIQYDK